MLLMSNAGMTQQDVSDLKKCEVDLEAGTITRKCLTVSVGRSFTSEDEIEALATLFGGRGVPRAIRSDNGPEFVSHAIRAWLSRLQIEPLYVAPWSLWENGFAESFHPEVGDELLRREECANLAAARKLTAA